jgi:NAD(P)H-flavin reductase
MLPRSRRALLLVALRASSTLASEQSCSAVKGPLPYTLQQKWTLSHDSFLLRFSLPPARRFLGSDLALPTCIKVLYPNGADEKTGQPRPLEKSYSPVSHPATEGFMDLVVKAYAPRPGGGVGAYLCNLEVGETVMGTVKSKRMMHGDASVLGRWTNIGLVAGGTGIAPLLQIARIILEEEATAPATGRSPTRVHLLSINRHEEDILMREHIDAMAAANPGRFLVTYSLTGVPPTGWQGRTGRGDADMIKAALPPPTGDGATQILVCGTDGFVATWGGPVGRAPRQADGSKGPKIQGPLQGLLAAAGYNEAEVFKY